MLEKLPLSPEEIVAIKRMAGTDMTKPKDNDVKVKSTPKTPKTKKLRYTELEAQVAELSVAKAQTEEKLQALQTSLDNAVKAKEAATLRSRTLVEAEEEKVKLAQKDANLLRGVLYDRLQEDEDNWVEAEKIRKLYEKPLGVLGEIASKKAKEDFPESVEDCHRKLAELRTAFAQETLKKSRAQESLTRARKLILRLCKLVPDFANPWATAMLPLMLGAVGIMAYGLSAMFRGGA